MTNGLPGVRKTVESSQVPKFMNTVLGRWRHWQSGCRRGRSRRRFGGRTPSVAEIWSIKLPASA